ncbi:MAG: long-chain fatty acid--CoA ligase, partial [Ignavibacteria bacterium]|nr:long-chain fatty acid--CoA ligase [Ignavibacteria bacterium]
MEETKNFTEFFLNFTAGYKDKPLLFWKEENEYLSISGNELKKKVLILSRKLSELGLKKGDTAAIISESRIEWVISDFACIVNGIITVPVYTTMSSDQIRYIMSHAECRICFVSGKIQTDKVISIVDELPQLENIITIGETGTVHNKLIPMEKILNSGNIDKEYVTDEHLINSAAKQAPDDILTIIYTSGTTGKPKGVMLTHKNILTNISQCLKSFHVDENDRFLSFLPLAHTYERTCGYYVPLAKGARIYYAQSIDTLSTQMTEVKPTLLLSVPLLFERIRQRLMKNIESMPYLKKVITLKALKYAGRYRENKNHFLWKISDRLVLKKIRERTGGKIRFFVSGGSALNKDLAEFFDSIGITILQGYGMTEASPVISVNKTDRNKFGTVGLPLEGVDIKIADDGEILCRGDNVMKGYFKNEKDTSETIINGWLHTGDIGEFDSEGFLKITDRKKTLIKTSGGKYISLTHIEDTLLKSEYISQIICFASDTTQFVSALIVPDEEKISELALKNNISFNSLKDLVN